MTPDRLHSDTVGRVANSWRGLCPLQPLLLGFEISLFWRTSCARDFFHSVARTYRLCLPSHASCSHWFLKRSCRKGALQIHNTFPLTIFFQTSDFHKISTILVFFLKFLPIFSQIFNEISSCQTFAKNYPDLRLYLDN